VTFNVMEHEMVPEHRLLSQEEAEAILRALRVAKEQLPKIKRSDPCIRLLEEIHGPVEEGRIVKITRRSPTAGIFEAYRMVVER
jgi:DNA-directed RNA polymerase subunit H